MYTGENIPLRKCTLEKMYTGENVHWRKQVARNLYFDVDIFREGVVVYIAALFSIPILKLK